MITRMMGCEEGWIVMSHIDGGGEQSRGSPKGKARTISNNLEENNRGVFKTVKLMVLRRQYRIAIEEKNK